MRPYKNRTLMHPIKPKRFIAPLLVVVLLALAGWPGVGVALTDSEIHKQAIEGFYAEKNIAETAGKYSSEHLNQSIFNLVNVENGTVASYTYAGDSQQLTINTYTVASQSFSSAYNKLTRYVFEVRNMYYPQNATVISGVYGSEPGTVRTWTYGPQKDEAMLSILSGLTDCLGNLPIYGGSDSGDSSSSTWVDKYSPEQIATTIATATSKFSINSTTYTMSSSSTDEVKTVEMDVAPEVINDRTYVPVRYLAYALGVDETGVTWDDKTNTASITKDKTTVKMTIGSRFLNVNGKSDTIMDVAPYVKDGRTMLPARWIAEPLGATVTWIEESQQMQIELPQPQVQQ